MTRTQRTAAFIATRLGSMALTIVGATLLLFLMVRLVPGDFASVMLGPRATPQLRAQIVHDMGLDRIGARLGNDEHGPVEPTSQSVVDGVVEQRLARRPHLGHLLHASETRPAPRGHHHQCH